MRSDGVINVNTGPNIGRGICLIELSNHICEQIVSGHNVGAQMVSVWPKGGND